MTIIQIKNQFGSFTLAMSTKFQAGARLNGPSNIYVLLMMRSALFRLLLPQKHATQSEVLWQAALESVANLVVSCSRVGRFEKKNKLSPTDMMKLKTPQVQNS